MFGLNSDRKRGPVSWLITALVLAVVAGTMIYTMVSEPEAVVDKENLKINTMMYGVTQPINDITDIKLSNDAPRVTVKTNGIGLGSIDRGWFNVEGMGNGRLYIHTDSRPFVYITAKNSFIIINYKDTSKTQKLYDELMKNWKKQ